VTIDPEELREAVRRDDGSRVRDLLRDATEADRRACAAALRDSYARLQAAGVMPASANVADGLAFLFWRGGWQLGGRPADEYQFLLDVERNRTPAFVAAALGLAGGIRIAEQVLRMGHLRWTPPAEDYDLIAAVLADRNPRWLADLIARSLDSTRRWGLAPWPLARRLVRLGVIAPPDAPGYTTWMVGSLTSQFRHDYFSTLLSNLLDDPGLLDDEVWRLFTVPGAGPALARAARPWEDAWGNALATLAERGLLNRGRLLDACLGAFVRDFAANEVGWYAAFHDRLAPTLEEMAERSSGYLALLAATSKAGVTLGQRTCDTLLDARRLDVPAFLAASAAALQFPQKAVAVTQLKLLGRIAVLFPAQASGALVAAAQAFLHPREDVQQAALRLIANRGVPADPAARAAISDLAASLSPVLARDAAALGLTAAPSPAHDPAPSVSADSRAAVSPRQVPVTPSAGPEPVAPVTDPGELVQLLARLLEDASDALAVERALAGAVRLAALPLDDRAKLAGPLLNRATRLGDMGNPFSAPVTRAGLACLTMGWATGTMPSAGVPLSLWNFSGHWLNRDGSARSIRGILGVRIRQAVTFVTARYPALLLAEPEFSDGAISHDTFLNRTSRLVGISRPGAPPGASAYDLQVALLRLAPDTDDAFWAQWATITGLDAAAARDLCERASAPLDFEIDADGPNLPKTFARLAGPALAGQPAASCWRLLTDLATEYRIPWEDQTISAWPLLAPHQPELIAAHLLQPLSNGLESKRSVAVAAVGCLAPAGHPFGKAGHFALATGLSAADPAARIAAADTWIRVARDGRLSPVLAADAITLGVSHYALRLSRLTEALRQCTHDPAAAPAVAHTMMLAAAALLPAKPGGPHLHLLLELACQAVATSEARQPDTGAAAMHVPPPLVALASSRDRTKLAESGRRLIQLTSPA
jgi:hypothetical protein